MYDCLTAEEESKLFLQAMDDYAKSIDLADAVWSNNNNNEQRQQDNNDIDAPLPVLPHNVYTESEVKSDNSNNSSSSNQPIFFIAGRGGETNFHAGNNTFRERVLQYTQSYISAGTKGRGKKFARSLMRDRAITSGVIFVVRQSYFAKNCKAGKISAARKNSVLQEHAPCTLNDLLQKEEESNHYLTIGEDWIVGIITDLLRTSASKFMASASSANKQPQQQQLPSAAMMRTPQQSSAAMPTRKRGPPPCPEISIPHDEYQQQQQYHQQPQQYELFQNHEDCSLSSVSDDEDYSFHSSGGMDSSSRGSTASAMSASNDMFLSSSSYPQQQQQQQPEMQMPPLHNKRARIMTVTTTTIPASSIPTAPYAYDLPQQQQQQSWASLGCQQPPYEQLPLQTGPPQQQFYGYDTWRTQAV